MQPSAEWSGLAEECHRWARADESVLWRPERWAEELRLRRASEVSPEERAERKPRERREVHQPP